MSAVESDSPRSPGGSTSSGGILKGSKAHQQSNNLAYPAGTMAQQRTHGTAFGGKLSFDQMQRSSIDKKDNEQVGVGSIAYIQ